MKKVAQELLKIAKGLTAGDRAVVYEMWADHMGSLQSAVGFGSMKTVARHDIDIATRDATNQLTKRVKVLEEVAKEASLELRGKKNIDVHDYSINIINGELVVSVSTVIGFEKLGSAINTHGKEMPMKEAVLTVMKNARIPVER